ncbi:MAG: hypothetical protein U1F66_13145 [bacterium]
MKNWKAIGVALLVTTLVYSGCSKNQKAPAGEEESPGAQVTAAEPVEKALVDGCEGNGTLAGAKTAFAANDFKEANRQARCAFNDSVKADPNSPNTEAAFYAFLSSMALAVESPQFQYVADLNIQAKTVFGTDGDPDNLTTQLAAKYPGDGLVLARNFFKFHEQKGHSISDVVGKAAEFIGENFDDWHVLLKAMATDPKFINSKIPAHFNDNSTELVFTFTEASYYLPWVDALRFAAKVYPYYDLGITNSDSFADINTLVQDMNTAPKLLSLKGTANGSALLPYLDVWLSAYALGAGNVIMRPPEAWLLSSDLLKDTIPHDFEGQAKMAIFVSQLKDSIRGGTVFLSNSQLKTGIDLKKMATELPDSAKVAENPVEVKGDGLDFRDAFIKEFFKNSVVTRP